MATSGYVRDRALNERLEQVHMTRYERAAALQQMEDAMWIADVMMRAGARIEAVARSAGAALRALFVNRRYYTRKGVAHSD